MVIVGYSIGGHWCLHNLLLTIGLMAIVGYYTGGYWCLHNSLVIIGLVVIGACIIY